MSKQVAVLIRHSPFNTPKAGEALRMSVGLTLADHRVTAILVDAGVLAAVSTRGDLIGAEPLARHIHTLRELGHRVWAEAESVDRFDAARGGLLAGVEVFGRARIEEELTASDVVIPY